MHEQRLFERVGNRLTRVVDGDLHRSKRELAEGNLSGEDGGAAMDAGALLTLLRDEA